ncbi:MAG: hypothetical protein JOY82_18990 [Streptosporangiaceae bacterium]|nr:hypothetical protein [Streptosporangiaceae bacterium]MBV9856571.1 hypothetical protein [Streptosporangiaceae bacterium]
MRGQAAHPDAEVLAEFRAGLIGGMRGRRLAAHVAGCSQCAATDARLAEVSTALASVPAPSLPDPVAARISMALAAEASARAPAGSPIAATDHAASAGAGNSQRVVTRRDRRHGSPIRGRGAPGGRWPRPVRPAMLVPAAAVFLLLAVGGGLLLSRPGAPSRQSAPSAARAPAIGMSPHGGLVQPGPDHMSPTTPANGSPSIAASGASGAANLVVVIASGADYRRGTLRSQVETQLRKPRRATSIASPSLSACALEVTGGTPPVFVDAARYQSRPVYVIVTHLRAWVVGTGCTAASPDVITSVPLRLVSTGAGISAP